MTCNDEDWRLCQAAAKGSAEAYTELYHRYAPAVRVCLHRHFRAVGSTELEDLEQQVWCAVWLALARFDGRSEVATWLVAITKHVAGASARAQRRAELTLTRFSQLGQTAPGAEWADRLWDRLSLADALAGLAPVLRRVIELRYFGGLTDREIAGRLQVPLGTIKGRLRAGLTRLRRCLRRRQPAATRAH